MVQGTYHYYWNLEQGTHDMVKYHGAGYLHLLFISTERLFLALLSLLLFLGAILSSVFITTGLALSTDFIPAILPARGCTDSVHSNYAAVILTLIFLKIRNTTKNKIIRHLFLYIHYSQPGKLEWEP